jgi:hypothetical protein
MVNCWLIDVQQICGGDRYWVSHDTIYDHVFFNLLSQEITEDIKAVIRNVMRRRRDNAMAKIKIKKQKDKQ